MVIDPFKEVIPLTTPNVPTLVLVVPLLSFEIVFSDIVIVPVPALYIP